MDTSSTIFIAGAVIIFIAVLVWFSKMGGSLEKAVAEARKTKEIKPIIEAIDADKAGDEVTNFNVAIKTLWDAYERELAMDLIRELLERNDKAPIAQKWLQDALSVEVELARKQLGKDFIDAHFHEDIAQGCVGCGGSCRTCK